MEPLYYIMVFFPDVFEVLEQVPIYVIMFYELQNFKFSISHFLSSVQHHSVGVEIERETDVTDITTNHHPPCYLYCCLFSSTFIMSHQKKQQKGQLINWQKEWSQSHILSGLTHIKNVL